MHQNIADKMQKSTKYNPIHWPNQAKLSAEQVGTAGGALGVAAGPSADAEVAVDVPAVGPHGVLCRVLQADLALRS